MPTSLFSWGFKVPDLARWHAASQEGFAHQYGAHWTFLGAAAVLGASQKQRIIAYPRAS
jgi:hypothetical protein